MDMIWRKHQGRYEARILDVPWVPYCEHSEADREFIAAWRAGLLTLLKWYPINTKCKTN